MENALGELIKAGQQPGREELEEIGRKVGHLYTDQGLPIDFAFAKFEHLTKLQKLSILNGACQWLVQHKRNSGATDKSIERQRSANRKMIESFVKNGETGAY